MALKVIELPCTAFKRYGTKRSYKLDSIEIHSIGVAQNDAKVIRNNMNQYSPDGIVHAICDCKQDDTVYVLLPKDNTSWADGGYGNGHSYTIEMAESKYMKYTSGAVFSITDQAKFKAEITRGYNTMVKYVAQLCKEFNFSPTDKLSNGLYRVYSHDEARRAGLATAHVDVSHLWPKIGKDMDKFRAEVSALLNNSAEVSQIWYRVRKSWTDAESQKGAYSDMENAKKECDRWVGYSVYNADGVAVYESKAVVDVVASGIPNNKETFLAAVSQIAQELYPKTKILPSVVIAQCCLETGYGLGKDCAELMQVNNLLGMKSELINNTWKDYTVWSGQKIAKVTPEYYNGKLTYITDYFRVYTDYYNCIEDYEMFLLHVRNDAGLKYAHVAGMTDPEKVITAISKGGYATDPSYITKVIALIKENNLTQYDNVTGSAGKETTSKDNAKTTDYVYRVQAGAYEVKGNATKLVNRIKNKAGLPSFVEQEGSKYFVYSGSFSVKENADKRAAELNAAGIKAFVKKTAL